MKNKNLTEKKTKAKQKTILYQTSAFINKKLKRNK
ncbi:hypothetical protein NC652_010164 [Populus alba x Populus x berolinensis]|nr:hypothetical protein NC652_010164 [Populus alba x Populus x berolinensis]